MQQLGGNYTYGGGGLTGLGQYVPVAHDLRPVRVRLQERIDRNTSEIQRLTADTDSVTALLSELDEHPYVERISDAVRKILG